MRQPSLFAVIVAATLAACSADELGDDDREAFGDGPNQTLPDLAYGSIASAEQFRSMAFAGGVALQGPSVKFLIDNRNPQTATVRFQNSKYKKNGQTPQSAKYHYYFALATLPGFNESGESFNRATYYQSDHSYYAGTIQAYQLKPGAEPLYGIQFYPEDVIAEGSILQAVGLVKAAFRIDGAKLAFVATGPQQTTASIASELAALGLENTSVDKLLGSITYLPMNVGEAWGYLRIFPSNPDDLSPLDLPVYDELPLDLAVVAGVITRSFQDASSHVNLKSKERGTPDMVLRDAGPDHPLLETLADQPVHLKVGLEGFTIEASTDAKVLAWFKQRTNKPWVPPKYEPTDQLLSYAELCPGSPAGCIAASARYGSKAANLGLLTEAGVLGRATDAGSPSAEVGYDLVPDGFAVPIKLYHDFVNHAPNGALRSQIDALIAAEKQGTLKPSARAALVQQVQQAFYAAEMPAELLKAVKTKLQQVLPGVAKIKIRSSANAEDLANFDGAGLYDSFSANLTKTDNPDGSCVVKSGDDGVETKLEMSPKTLACGIKGVFASVWNKRAIEERSFARIDHAAVGMGLAIVPKYDNDSPVAANSVVVTRVIGNDGIYGYSFSTQQGNNLVTNPTPGTISENVIAAFSEPSVPPTFTPLRYAVPVAGQPALTKTVLSTDQMKTMLKIVQAAETAYCLAKPSYHPGGCDYVTMDPEKPTALDLEFKILENGHFVCKQIREFSGR